MAGYSGTPLEKKLGIKEGFTIGLINAPEYYFGLFENLPNEVVVSASERILKDLIHFFTKEENELMYMLPLLKTQMKQDGMIWVSWPKKAAKADTDVTEDIIRNTALSIGLVDVKVCAVDEVWSALKLVIPVKERKKQE